MNNSKKINDVLASMRNRIKPVSKSIPSLRKTRKPEVETGLYKGMIQNISYEENVTTKGGMATRIQLVVAVAIIHPVDGSIRIEEVKETFYIADGFNWRFTKRFEPLLGHNPHDGFDTQLLIGKEVELEIVHNTDHVGNVYANFGSMELKEMEEF